MERLKLSGFRAPALIAAGSTPQRTLRALGMKLPDTMTADSIAEALGRSHRCGKVLHMLGIGLRLGLGSSGSGLGRRAMLFTSSLHARHEPGIGCGSYLAAY